MRTLSSNEMSTVSGGDYIDIFGNYYVEYPYVGLAYVDYPYVGYFPEYYPYTPAVVAVTDCDIFGFCYTDYVVI